MDPRPLRYRCDVEASLERDGEPPLPVRAVEVSATGAFLATDADLQVGDRATLKLELPGGPPWVVPVAVSRLGVGHEEIRPPGIDPIVVARVGAGVEFLEIPPDERERLKGFMELLDER